jgi:transposase
MRIHPGFVGIDVCKHHLDIFDPALGGERVANTAASAAALAARFAASGARVLFEATGIYDEALRQALAAAGVSFSRVNPGRARDFARAAGFLAKTDQVDARMLAAMAQCLQPPPQPPADAQRERLARLSKRRDQLVAMRQQERTRRRECHDSEIAADLDGHLASLDQAIIRLERIIARLIDGDADLARAGRLLRSVPGIGPVAATTLIALLPELGSRSPKSIAALAGLAPLNADSGLFRGKRPVRGGRKRVRDALYMAAVSAARSSSRFAAFYKALRQAGKPPKLALIALARKLLISLNAIIRDQRPFHP